MPYIDPTAKLFSSKKFKQFFLLEFTRQLVNHSVTDEMIRLQIALKKRKKEERVWIKEKLRELKEVENQEKKKLPKLTKKKIGIEEAIEEELKSEPIPGKFRRVPARKRPRVPMLARLRIPEIKLPLRLQYLRPTPKNIKIDLLKLTPLVNDPAVRHIECNGPDKPVMVEGKMGRKKTKIILNKEDIENIINKFAELSKIPIHEGIYRVVLGKLVFSAIISNIVGSKFIIKKMAAYSPGIMPRPGAPSTQGRF